MDWSKPAFPILHHLLDLAQTLVHWVGDSIQPSHPLSSHSSSFNISQPSIFPSIRVFSNELVLCIRWPKTGVSASASVLPMNIQDWFPLGLTDLISLQFKGLSRVFSDTTAQKYQSFLARSFLWSNSLMTTGKVIALTIWTFVDEVMSLLFNMLPRFIIAFLPRSQFAFPPTM